MTRELAMIHAREGIRFNSLCPYVTAVVISFAKSVHPVDILPSTAEDH
jgi:NAD(P)-dependent dehydrogenase (short-subunit alcohol dehydrogenase family)